MTVYFPEMGLIDPASMLDFGAQISLEHSKVGLIDN